MNRVWLQMEKPKERSCRSSEKGQAAIEFAFIAPVLLLLLLAVADFGRVFFVSVSVNNAARAGAQYGSQSVTDAADSTGMEAAATTDGANISGWNKPTASQCTCVASQNIPACAARYCMHAPQATYVTVGTSATFNTIFPYPGIPSSITLTGQAIMQVQEN